MREKIVPPVIAELFKLMPSPGTDWPLYDRVAFLQSLESVFHVVYGKAGGINIVASAPPRFL
jgi:hypothetical protein